MAIIERKARHMAKNTRVHGYKNRVGERSAWIKEDKKGRVCMHGIELMCMS